jgi:hypothetical protein
MPSPDFGSGLDRIQYRRESWLQIITSAGILAFLINLATNILFSALFAETHRGWWWSCFAYLLLVIYLASAWVYAMMSRKEEPVDIRQLELILPIHVDAGQIKAKVVTHERYWLSGKANELMSARNREFKERFIAQWIKEHPATVEFGVPGCFCWDSLALLVEASILQWINRHARETLKPKANYRRRFRHVAGRLAGRDFPSAEEASPFTANDFIYPGGNPTGAFPPLYLPRTASLEREFFTKEGTIIGSSTLKLTTPYGAVTIEISPYWIALSGSRLAKAMDLFRPRAPSSTTFFEIPVEVRLDIWGLPMCRQKCVDAEWHYKWLYQLMDEFDRRLDWVGIKNRRRPTK